MVAMTIAVGLLFIVLGLGGYFGSGQASITAAIPVVPGIPLLVLGLIAIKASARKHAIHAAVMFGLLSLICSVVMIFVMWGRWKAVWALVVMTVLSGIYVGLCVRSFIAVRKARKAAA